MLKGKVALVTGGARGIGKEITYHLAKAGADLIICGQNDKALQTVQEDLSSTGVKIIASKTDVTDSAQVEELIAKGLDKFGGIHILVNNAGVTRDKLLMRMTESDWDEVININLKGTFLCTKHVSKVMIKQKAGRIINVSSIIGIMGNAGQANYAASKGGMNAFTKTVAKELATRNITVNAIAPGFIQTDMTDQLSEDVRQAMLEQIPVKRFGTSEDVSNLVLFLASDLSSYITGETIKITGGLAM